MRRCSAAPIRRPDFRRPPKLEFANPLSEHARSPANKLPVRLQDELRTGRAVSRRSRNRRIGGYSIELDLAARRATGIPGVLKWMAANGAPVPVFESNDERVSFLIRLPTYLLAAKLNGRVAGTVCLRAHRDGLACSGLLRAAQCAINQAYTPPELLSRSALSGRVRPSGPENMPFESLISSASTNR